MYVKLGAKDRWEGLIKTVSLDLAFQQFPCCDASLSSNQLTQPEISISRDCQASYRSVILSDHWGVTPCQIGALSCCQIGALSYCQTTGVSTSVKPLLCHPVRLMGCHPLSDRCSVTLSDHWLSPSVRPELCHPVRPLGCPPLSDRCSVTLSDHWGVSLCQTAALSPCQTTGVSTPVR